MKHILKITSWGVSEIPQKKCFPLSAILMLAAAFLYLFFAASLPSDSSQAVTAEAESYNIPVLLSDTIVPQINGTQNDAQTGNVESENTATEAVATLAIRIQKGDTLWSLAKLSGVSVDELVALNNLHSAEEIRIGETLVIPEGGAVTYASLASRGSISYQWPLTGKITSYFGARDSGFHHGLDIAAPAGTKIYAAREGTVTFAGYHSSVYGNTVIIDHGNNQRTLYAHAKTILVKKGDKVTVKTAVATVGSTGNSTGNHLHFQININDTPVDPLAYLR